MVQAGDVGTATDLEFIRFQVLASTPVKGIVVDAVLFAVKRSQRPYRVLEAHGGAHMRWRMKGTEIAVLVDDGDKVLLVVKEYLVAAWCQPWPGPPKVSSWSYSSSIISKGGKLSKRPRPMRELSGKSTSGANMGC